MAANADTRHFAFIFPMASGHINPSLPIARSLVKLGHQVDYLCREQMREAIEDTGARFHTDIENQPEMYEGREPSLWGALEDIKKEYGMEGESFVTSIFKLREIMLEMMLPGTIRWLQRIRADTVVYCPMMNLEAAYAAKVLGIPSIALLTTAGPGSLAKAMNEFLAQQGLSRDEVLEIRTSFAPLRECLGRLEARYGLSIDIHGGVAPMGRMDSMCLSHLTLVTTCEDLQDPVPSDLAEFYQAKQVNFAAVGPLLDQQGARRAAGHKFSHSEQPPQQRQQHSAEQNPLAQLRAARAAGRKVILVSMGTVITGDSPDFGWGARLVGSDGVPAGLTGKELCQAAWGGSFDAFGSDSCESPLLLVALGPQPKALGDLEVPANAFCLPVMPQVDVLKEGVDLFLTHGGQNSFMEALSTGTPVVVCPGFGDQPVNARKAVDLGVGLQVERPVPGPGEEARATEAYRAEVATALREVFSAPVYRETALSLSQRMQAAGGVPRAVELVLGVAAAGKETSKSAAADLGNARVAAHRAGA